MALPELLRIKGELMWRQGGSSSDALQTLCAAVQSSRDMGALIMELRAASSLARVWQSQGKNKKARDLLAPVYDRFTEGFDTADLKEAKALLDELK